MTRTTVNILGLYGFVRTGAYIGFRINKSDYIHSRETPIVIMMLRICFEILNINEKIYRLNGADEDFASLFFCTEKSM